MKNNNILVCFIVSILVLTSFILIDNHLKLNGFLMVGGCILLYLFYSNGKINLFTKKDSKPEIGLLISSLVFIFSLYVLNDILIRIFFSEYRYFDIKLLLETNYSFFFILKAIVIFPFLEEMIFRKTLLHSLLNKYSMKTSLFVSALGFTLVHFVGDSGLHYVFLGGLFLGYIYYKFRSLVLCFIVHAFNNLLVMILPSVSLSLFQKKYSAILVLLILILSSSFFLSFKYIRKKPCSTSE